MLSTFADVALMVTGTDVAIESAGITLTEGDLVAVVCATVFGKATTALAR